MRYGRGVHMLEEGGRQCRHIQWYTCGGFWAWNDIWGETRDIMWLGRGLPGCDAKSELGVHLESYVAGVLR